MGPKREKISNVGCPQTLQASMYKISSFSLLNCYWISLRIMLPKKIESVRPPIFVFLGVEVCF